jgi:hypothetical protein
MNVGKMPVTTFDKSFDLVAHLAKWFRLQKWHLRKKIGARKQDYHC